jgi:hypothetical protein
MFCVRAAPLDDLVDWSADSGFRRTWLIATSGFHFPRIAGGARFADFW